MRNELKLSASTLARRAFSCSGRRLDNQPMQLNALTQPLLLQNIISHKGFKALAFVGGSADIVYAIDYDLNRVYWKQRLNTARVRRTRRSLSGRPHRADPCDLLTPPGMPGARGGPRRSAGQGDPGSQARRRRTAVASTRTTCRSTARCTRSRAGEWCTS